MTDIMHRMESSMYSVILYICKRSYFNNSGAYFSWLLYVQTALRKALFSPTYIHIVCIISIYIKREKPSNKYQSSKRLIFSQRLVNRTYILHMELDQPIHILHHQVQAIIKHAFPTIQIYFI